MTEKVKTMKCDCCEEERNFDAMTGIMFGDKVKKKYCLECIGSLLSCAYHHIGDIVRKLNKKAEDSKNEKQDK